MQNFRIGIIGMGSMSNAHISGFKNVPNVTITAICDIDQSVLETYGVKLNIPVEKRFTDFRLLIQDSEVDAVVSVTPNNVHAEIMKSCLEAGKPFLSEKPFTMDLQEAEQLKAVYEKSPVPCMVGFTYRYTPAFRYVRELLNQGKVGNVRSFMVQYMQGWGSSVYKVPYVWRFDKEITGTGTLGDLGAHMIDLAHYLIGPFNELSAQMETFVPQRKSTSSDRFIPVKVDDFASFQARMDNGAIGLFQTTRNAIGSGNQLEISIYAEQGTLHASTLNPEQVVWIFRDEENGDIVEQKLTVPSQVKLTEWEDFIQLLSGHPSHGLPNFMDGYINQKILEAIIRSNELKKTVLVNDQSTWEY